MRHDDDDAFDENGILKDGRSVKFEARDSLQKDVAKHFQRPAPVHVTDQFGDAGLGLHRPGFRLGHAGDRALRDSERQEAEDAYAAYDHTLTNSWKRRDAMAADPGEAAVEARAASVRNALLNRGHHRDDIEDFLASCDDSDLLDRDVSQHVQSFESAGERDARTVAVDRRLRLNELYLQRDREYADQWKRK
jgi:hypothetical protein